MKHADIRFCTEELDFSALPNQQFDWAYAVYGHIEAVVSHDMPTPLGKFVTIMHYVDATCTMALLLGDQSLVSYILPTRVPLISTPRHRQLWRQPLMDQSSLLPISVWINPLTSRTPSLLGCPHLQESLHVWG